MDTRKDFPLLNKEKVIYLDNSSTTQKPTSVLTAMQQFAEHDNANVHRSVYALAQRATAAYEKARDVVAGFINAKREEVIFTRGTTESLNLVAYSYIKQLQPGDEIILTEMEHHSALVPWQRLADEYGLVVKYIPLTKDYRLDLEKAAELITIKTKVVSLIHMSNVLGTINPVKEIIALAHAVGSIVIVDAAQSIAHSPIDVKDLDCDFLAFSGHKMYGPMGIGVLYGKRALLEKMEPFLYGGEMIKEVTFHKSTWNDLPWKFEAGTPNVAGAVGLAAAIEYILQVGWENIVQHEQELTKHALQKLKQIPGLKIIGPEMERGAVISFTLEGMHPHDIGEFLDGKTIAVRGGHHCAMPLFSILGIAGTTRVSFAVYNSVTEVDVLVQALLDLVQQGRQSSGIFDRNEITSAQLTEEQEIAKENILDHYKNPHNKSVLDHYTFRQREHNPLCGDEVTLYVNIEEDAVRDISFTGNGCAISQASISLLTDYVQGMTLQEVRALSHEDVLQLLGIPISQVRLKCALLSLKALTVGMEVMGYE